MRTRLAAAARNNADWCELVCRSLGVPARTHGSFWIALGPAPRLYPDAITLTPEASAREIMRLLEGRAAVTVKDSFAALELEREGFQVLFEARWLSHDSATSGALAQEDALTALDTQEQLSDWAAAAGLSDVLGPRVLSAPGVRVLAAGGSAGRIGAGAILNRSGHLVGVSNAFATDLALEELWSAIPRHAARLFPGCELVGYERGEHLDAALRAGFTTLGALRVWSASR